MKYLFLLGLLGASYLVSSFNPENYFTCPTPCEDNPCDCDDAGPCVSGTCNAASGCGQCEDGYWKKDYNYTCIGCTETFGDNCLFCTDKLGCQQCRNGSSRYYDDDCGLWYCIKDGSTYNGSVFDGDCPLECSSDPCTCAEGQNCLEGTCHVNGCDQCIDGFFKKNYSYHCVDCQEYAGDNCLHCTDFLGCQQCVEDSDTDLEYDDDCELYFCNGPFCEESVTISGCVKEDSDICLINCVYMTDLTFYYDNSKDLNENNGFPVLYSGDGDVMYVNDDGYLTIQFNPTDDLDGSRFECIYYSDVEVGDYDGSNDPFNNDVSWTMCEDDFGVGGCDISIDYEDCGETFNPGDFCTSDCIQVYNSFIIYGDGNEAGVSNNVMTSLIGDYCYSEEDGGGDRNSPPSPTRSPTDKPTLKPTGMPTNAPTERPTGAPTVKPTERPTGMPTTKPTKRPTGAPTTKPTNKPTGAPTVKPTNKPTSSPTGKPTAKPTSEPTDKPTNDPSDKPTESPTPKPTNRPSDSPTDRPSTSPTSKPTERPTGAPTSKPTQRPTGAPTVKPSERPTGMPTTKPSERPTGMPTNKPTSKPSNSPTDRPTASPVDAPSGDSCETAFAYCGDDNDGDSDGFGSYCFNDDGFSRWGWRMGLVDGSDYFTCCYVYAGAAKCDLDKGTFVGVFCLDIDSDGDYEAVYDNLESGYRWNEAHFYIGEDEYPTMPNGAETVAPGQYTQVDDGFDVDEYTFSGSVADPGADYWFIAHAVSCGDFDRRRLGTQEEEEEEEEENEQEENEEEEEEVRRLQSADYAFFVNDQGDVVSQFTVDEANRVVLEIFENDVLTYVGVVADNADDLCDGSDYFNGAIEITLTSQADYESETTIRLHIAYNNCPNFDEENCDYPFCTDECIDDADFAQKIKLNLYPIIMIISFIVAKMV